MARSSREAVEAVKVMDLGSRRTGEADRLDAIGDKREEIPAPGNDWQA